MSFQISSIIPILIKPNKEWRSGSASACQMVATPPYLHYKDTHFCSNTQAILLLISPYFCLNKYDWLHFFDMLLRILFTNDLLVWKTSLSSLSEKYLHTEPISIYLAFTQFSILRLIISSFDRLNELDIINNAWLNSLSMFIVTKFRPILNLTQS